VKTLNTNKDKGKSGLIIRKMWNLRTKSASGEEVFNPLTQKNLTPRGGRKKGQGSESY